MKRLLLVGLILNALVSHAQLKGALGQITDEERRLTVCEFDPEAAAIVLLDEGFSDHNDLYNLQTFRRTKIKVLKEEGIAQVADFQMNYYSKDGKVNVDGFNAIVTNFDESGKAKITVVDQQSIFRKKINSEYSRLSVAFPEIKVGSIIDFTYRYFADHYGFLQNWYFQRDIPVVKSTYELRMVPNLEMTYLAQYDPRYKLDVRPVKIHNGIIFEMKHIPALTEEPFMDAREDYVQKVIFQITKIASDYGNRKYMSSWDQLTRDLFERQDFGRQLKLKIDECQQYIATLTGKADLEKMRAIHKYVTSNTEWDGEYRLTSDGVRSLWKKKSGNSADINLLLVNLLQRAELDAYPMLVSERGNGKVNKANPFTDQFNNVYAVVFIGDKKYYLDATDKYTPAHQVPFSILNTTAFIVNQKKGGLVEITEPEVRYQEIATVYAELDESGKYAGQVTMSSKDYARTSRVIDYKKSEKEKYINKFLLKGLVNVNIDSLQMDNIENDTMPLKQVFKYNTYVQKTGDYSFINLNMFTGFESNPFILNDRFSTINFGTNRTLNLNCSIRLPQGFSVDALPGNIRLKSPDNSVVFMRELFYDDKKNIMVARIKVDINKSIFDVQEYASLKVFYKKMIDLMNEQVVLKKI